MPIYEYACKACGQVTELTQKIADPPLETCPLCGAGVQRIISRSSFQLKGGGWYKDLYSSSRSGGSSGSSD